MGLNNEAKEFLRAWSALTLARLNSKDIFRSFNYSHSFRTLTSTLFKVSLMPNIAICDNDGSEFFERSC